MPHGSSAAPGWFVKVINEVIKGLANMAAYLDDVSVFDLDPATHVLNIKELFKQLRKDNRKLTPSTANSGATDSEMRPSVSKVASLNNMPIPKDLRLLRPLLVGLSYCRKFPAKRIRPITPLLKQGVNYLSTPAMQTINLLEERLVPPVLVYPDWDAVTDYSRPFLFYCDASIDGFGATLEPKQKQGSIRPIVFISHATLESERHWTPLDLEAGSIVGSIKRLRGCLWGISFRICSDHKALESRAKVAEHNPRVRRWLEFIAAYRHTLEYRKCTANRNADFLSRLPMPASEDDRSGRGRLTPSQEEGTRAVYSGSSEGSRDHCAQTNSIASSQPWK